MTKILGVAETVLYVQTLAPARQFYTDVLGLPVAVDFGDACFLRTGPESTLALFEIDALEQLQSATPGHGARGRGHVALAIPAEEMDAWRERLQAHNVEIEHERDWPVGTHSLYFRDPDENSIELIDSRHWRVKRET